MFILIQPFQLATNQTINLMTLEQTLVEILQILVATLGFAIVALFIAILLVLAIKQINL
jgi:hypothetical protein